MTTEGKRTVYRARRIVCSDSHDTLPQMLSICNGVIVSISHEEFLERGAVIVDFSQSVIAPLFCDYHLHFSRKTGLRTAGMQLLSHGIGRVFDGGDKENYGLSLRDEANKRPEIRSSGHAICRKGGYGTVIGQCAESMKDAVGKIDELYSLSVDYIKIVHSGIFDPDSGQISPGGFRPEELTHLVEYATKKGLDVYCHANGEQAVREAVQAGVSAIIHGRAVNTSTLSLMAENNVAFIPTLNAFQSLYAITKTERGRANVQKAVSEHLTSVRRAHELGVRILPGSDAGPQFIPYGTSYLDELCLFEKAGMAHPDIIRAASMTVLRKGAPADFVVLDGLSVIQVVINGTVVT